ncbi:MAG TPA: saccharopine dehydrogenase NADP-binding domain-containing protein [Candidatus Binatia bacterium]|nr:saccharopine dehydrogenase NADP-binding domain-containing protein [Candidatus Binatia bacterium]
MDEMNPSKPAVAVIGATGHTGRFVVADVLRRGITPIAIARNAATLEAANFDTKVVRRQATVDDAESLDRALQGAQAVINTAGPFIATADPVASAALRAKMHYVDIAAEQVPTGTLFEQFDEPARKAGIVVLPAMAFFGGLADLMVTAIMKDWDAVDAVETFIGFDSWHPTQGTRNTIERKSVGNLVFTGGRLTPAPSSPAQKNWHFAAPVGDQVVLEMPFSETVLLSRHVKTAEHHNYLTQVAITDVLDPSTPPPKAADAMGRSAQNFVVEVVVTRGDEQRRACTRGRDGYAVTAPLTGEAVERLIKGQFRSAGAKTPGEIFDAEELLTALGPDHATFEGVTPLTTRQRAERSPK